MSIDINFLIDQFMAEFNPSYDPVTGSYDPITPEQFYSYLSIYAS